MCLTRLLFDGPFCHSLVLLSNWYKIDCDQSIKVTLLEEDSLFAVVPRISDMDLSENPNISFTAHASSKCVTWPAPPLFVTSQSRDVNKDGDWGQ